MIACHNEVGHLGVERCLDLLKDRFYWPNMNVDLEEYFRPCDKCIKFKAQPQKAELHPIMATHPLKLIYMNYMMNQESLMIN